MGGTTLDFLRGIASSAQRARSPGSGLASTYWRRRFLVLVVGLATFGLATWGLSSAIALHSSRMPVGHGRHGGQNRSSRGTGAQAAGGGSAPADHAATDAGRAVRRGQGSGRADEGSRALVTGSGQGSKSDQDGSGSGTAAGPHVVDISAGQANGRGTILPAFCARANIVLSVFSGQTQFGRDQQPSFDLSIVSTQKTGCSFNVGSAHLILVIREGPARIWSSAECPAGTAGLITALKRGVPTVVPVTWNRRTSPPGCSGPSSEVPPGVYTAYASDNGVQSRSVTFRLG